MSRNKLYLPRAVVTTSPTVTSAASQIIVPANPYRLGLIIYNNSANSGYIAYDTTCSSSTRMTAIIATFKEWPMPFPIYTGPISAIRNGAGTGTFIITELFEYM